MKTPIEILKDKIRDYEKDIAIYERERKHPHDQDHMEAVEDRLTIMRGAVISCENAIFILKAHPDFVCHGKN